MSNPAKLRFHAWHEDEDVFTVLGWRAQEGLAFAVDTEGQQLVVRFMPLTGTSTGSDATWRPPPFPEELPAKIEEIRLLPPPCRRGETEAEWLRQELGTKKSPKNALPIQFSHHHAAQPWELARLRYDPEVLTAQSEDAGPMTTRLDEFRIQVQREYEARKHEVETLIRLLDEGRPTVGEAHYYARHFQDPHDTGVARFFLNQERLKLQCSTPDCSKWTIDDARHWPLLCNPIFRARWAKQNNWDIQQNATERKELLDWLGIPASSLEMQLPKVFSVSSLFGSPPTDYESDKYTDPLSDIGVAPGNEMLVAATARYRVTFASGKPGWLKDCLFRQPQNQVERQEFSQGQDAVAGRTAAAELEQTKAKLRKAQAAASNTLEEALSKWMRFEPAGMKVNTRARIEKAVKMYMIEPEKRSFAKIGAEFHVSRQSVSKWFQKFTEETGFQVVTFERHETVVDHLKTDLEPDGEE